MGMIALIASILALGILLIRGMVAERERYANQVISEIGQEHVQPQTVWTPFIRIPVQRPCPVTNTEAGTATPVGATPVGCMFQTHVVVAATTSQWQHQVKVDNHSYKRGIYAATAYDDAVHINGEFTFDQLERSTGEQWDWAGAELILAISDLRGLAAPPVLTLNQQKQTFEPARTNDLGSAYLRLPLPLSPQGNATIHYQIDLALSGTQSLQIIPLDQTTAMNMKAAWPHPQFFGMALPARKSIGKQQFEAQWQNNYLAQQNRRNLASCLDMPHASGCLKNSGDESGWLGFGVKFVDPVDAYTLTDRSLKYALLFILMTFGAFFMFEVLKSLRIHPVQYSLVGAAQAVFYLLLLSFSEQFSFAWAYLAASAACIGLIGWYVSFVLKSARRALGLTILLAAMYATLYLLLHTEQYTLLLGSVLVFCLIGVMMYLTRRVDWYAHTDKAKPKTQPDKTTEPSPQQPTEPDM